MKLYFFLLLCCCKLNLFGQITADSTYHPDFTMENVKFNNAGVTLAGTLFKPKKTQAAVVIVHGSGQEVRTLNLASLLAKNGIAVLTYDKRGVGQSAGIYVGPEVGTNNVDSGNLNLLASDASAAVDQLLTGLPAKHGPIGLLGFSQAGWIIPIAAQKNNKVSFMVLFSGPVATTLEQLRFQFYTEGKAKFWDTHTEAEARDHIRNDPDRYQFLPTDPQYSLAKLSIRGLWIFGGKDVQAPVGLSIENLTALQNQRKKYEYQLFPELGHNTSSSKSPGPLNSAIQWIKNLKGRTKGK